MAKKISDAEKVREYMATLEHPLKKEIEAVRTIIKNSNSKIAERIKWAAPSYYYKEDLVTFNPRDQNLIHLIFHHPNIEKISSPILEGNYVSRRMTYLHNMGEIEANKTEIERILNQLVSFLDE
ncbi:DUF1801 domain-containing protein [Emticicia sp. C21]|uniref:DUF1801 domain-containing protein n=1 Tax=Emticicia sp. C21 TaxID=2302915 RepID=UPI000E3549C6|nr:DUF1801 domain-containing protein [Emticicia sp. C21]RFS15188.1 DUF1801 domain-containing protein [Emticicia sp. C21]